MISCENTAMCSPISSVDLVLSRMKAVNPAAIRQIQDIEKATRPGFLKELVGIFTRSADEHLGLLKQSVEEGNHVRIEREAHFIKGSAGNFGARRVVDLCARLEKHAHRRELASIKMLARELEA